MTGIEVVKKIKGLKGVSNSELARRLGYASPSGVRERLERTSDRNKEQIRDMTTDTLVKYLDALGYDLIVREKGKKRTEEFIITGKAEE